MKTLAKAECQVEIVKRLTLLREDDVALWGRMNCPQMVCHLSDAFRMVLRERRVKSIQSWLRGPHGRFLALHSGIPWGRGLATLPELDAVRQGFTSVNFSQDVSGLCALVSRFLTASELELVHPMFGPMKRGDWMRWGYLHTDHHLRQFGR